MKKLLLILVCLTTLGLSFGQSRGVKIGYIDMEYILEKVPAYAESKNLLEQKAQKWKQDIEVKKNEITKLKEALKVEKPLLTKELVEEREEVIKELEIELLDYQQDRFGPQGDLMIQKATLVKPIQDQVFSIVQDIAEAKRYDFIFDKASDLTMLFAQQRYDISDMVVKRLLRAEKTEKQLTKKQQKEQEAQERKEEMESDNPALAERNQKLAERKAAREALQKQKQDERERILAERKAAKEAKTDNKTTPTTPTETNKTNNKTKTTESESTSTEGAPAEKTTQQVTAEEREANRKRILDERAQKAEQRKKEAAEKRQKALEDRQANRKAKQNDTKTDTDTTQPEDEN